MRQHCLMFRCPGMNSLSVSRSPSHPPPCYLYLFLPLSPFSPPSPWVVVYPMGYSPQAFALDGDSLPLSETNPYSPLTIQVCWRWRVDAIVSCYTSSKR